MIEQIPPAFRSSCGSYTPRYDDGTNRYATWIEVEGIPGEWPDGYHNAAVARDVQAVAERAGPKLADERTVDYIIDAINDRDRVQDPLAAHWAAESEDPIREQLPAARERLAEAYEAMTAYWNTHGGPVEPIYDPSDPRPPQELLARRRAAQIKFAQAVGPIAFRQGEQLTQAHLAAQKHLGQLCSELSRRTRQALEDYEQGTADPSNVANVLVGYQP